MSNRLPLFLSDAQFALYLADANGLPLGSALWCGGFLNRLRLGMNYDEVVVAPSGAPFGNAHIVDEAHVLTFGQTWLVNRATLTDWRPSRVQTYVLQLIWTAGNAWFQRTYYGVTWRSLTLDAANTNQFLADQVVRAQTYADTAGVLAAPATPATVPAVLAQPSVLLQPPTASTAGGTAQTVGFFRETPLIVGEYLLGFYQWSAGVTLGQVSVIAWPSQGQPTVLELEVGGVLTGQTITIPTGPANVEVVAVAAFAGPVMPNLVVRWKVVSGPDPANAAWSCALMLTVTN